MAAAAEPTEAELNGLLATELKQRLEVLGLSKGGNKAQLVARLLAHRGGEVQQLRKQLAALSQRHTTVLGQHNALTQQHSTLTTQHGTLTQQHGTLALQHGRLKTHAGTLTEQQGTLKTQLSTLTTEHGALTTRLARLGGMHDAVQQSASEAAAKLEALERHTATLQGQHITLKQQHGTTTEQHAAQATQHKTLLAKHSMLEQMAFAPDLFLATRDGQVPVTRAWLQGRACERLQQLAAAAAPASNVLTLPVVCNTEVVRLLVHALTDGELPEWAAASCRKLGNSMQLLELSHALDFELGASLLLRRQRASVARVVHRFRARQVEQRCILAIRGVRHMPRVYTVFSGSPVVATGVGPLASACAPPCAAAHARRPAAQHRQTDAHPSGVRIQPAG